MPAAQPLRVAAHGGAPNLQEPAVKEPPHLVLVTPASAGAHEAAPSADVRRQSFGPRLRAARERKGVTLHQIAESTKVSVSFLSALERGDVSRWPKGIFRRSFFRDYVVAIGLPAEPYLAEFLQLFPDGEAHPTVGAVAEKSPIASLRLTLAPVPGVSRDKLGAAAIELAVVVAVAALVVWWFGGGAFTGAGVLALCYYQRVIAAARARRLRWPRAPRSGDDRASIPTRPAAIAPAPPTPER